MKKIITLFLLLLLSANIFADDDEKLKLAVMEFEDLSGKVSKATLAEASEYFRVIFAQTNRYIIISKDRQKEQISDMRKKYNTDPSYKSCTDKNCQIQLGQALSADLIVKTSISYFAGFYTLASELIDLEKEATIIAATEEYDGSPKEMRTAIQNIVNKIVEAEKKESGETVPQESRGTEPQKSESAKNQKEIIPVTVEEYTNPDENQSSSNKFSLIDEQTCIDAREKSTVADWVNYVNTYPEGKCSDEARTNLENLKRKPDNWSYKAPEKMNWSGAVRYCKNLEEDGHKDWHLPDINELRSLTINCPKAEPKGECPMTTSFRSAASWSAKKCFCEQGAHNKLGDSDPLWSSTGVAFTFFRVKFAFYSSRGVGMSERSQKFSVRCTRDDKKEKKEEKDKK